MGLNNLRKSLCAEGDTSLFSRGSGLVGRAAICPDSMMVHAVAASPHRSGATLAYGALRLRALLGSPTRPPPQGTVAIAGIDWYDGFQGPDNQAPRGALARG